MENCKLTAFQLYQKLVQVLPGFAEWTQKELVEVQKLLTPEKTILDVGCGWGRSMKELAPSCRRIIGIDIDPEEIKKAKSYLGPIPNADLLVAEAKKVQFSDESFDMVMLTGNTFGNLGKDAEAVLQEMIRLVRKDGKLILSVFSAESNLERIKAYKEVGLPIKAVENGTIIFDDGFISKGFNREELHALSKKYGLNGQLLPIGSFAFIILGSK